MKNYRQKLVSQLKRVVIKVGSRLLVDENKHPSKERIQTLISQISAIRDRGVEVILVSSGAISAGMSVLGWEKRPKDLPNLQAAAATGQSKLMSLYEDASRGHGFHCAQLLLTADDVKNRKRHLNFTNCLNALLARGVLPIINENDSVSVAEICFGENDYLAALVGIISKAELTVLLTSVNGMFAKNEDGTFGERFSVINEITPELRQMASGTDGNELSSGGMKTKLKAAEAINQVGENLWILDGTEFDVLSKLMNAEDLGTLFPGSDEKMRAHKRWMAFFPEITGTLVIDAGAQKALVKQGSSLLPGGILFVEGNFIKGDIIEIRSLENILLAKGAVNYSSAELKNLKGKKTAEISGILGYHSYDEAIHRDNLVLLKSEEK